jgi:hypothetical protein
MSAFGQSGLFLTGLDALHSGFNFSTERFAKYAAIFKHVTTPLWNPA